MELENNGVSDGRCRNRPKETGGRVGTYRDVPHTTGGGGPTIICTDYSTTVPVDRSQPVAHKSVEYTKSYPVGRDWSPYLFSINFVRDTNGEPTSYKDPRVK